MITRPTVLEVDLNAFKYNASQIKKYIGSKEIMPVIKANAYGTYINKCLKAIKDFTILAVATVDEGKELRRLGYKNNILVLNQPAVEELKKIIKYNLTVGLSSKEFLNVLVKTKDKVKVHLEIETGMSRTGINLSDLSSYLDKLLKNRNIQVEGIYTHLSSADSDEKYTIKQLECFSKAISIIKEKIGPIRYIHSLASNGIINYLSNDTNIVRPGIMLYGYESFRGVNKKIDLKPVCKLKSKIVFLKEVPKKTAIGYSQTYITKKKTKIATIPIGYADGLKRSLSNRGYIVVNNKRCKIIGNICMDSCLIDVSNLKDVKVGDDVYIWDNENVTVEEISKLCNTINYEILSTISDRVPRIFV